MILGGSNTWYKSFSVFCRRRAAVLDQRKLANRKDANLQKEMTTESGTQKLEPHGQEPVEKCGSD